MTIDLSDIQGNLLRGYRCANARHFALAVGDPKGAAQFIAGLLSGDEDASPQVTSAAHWGDDRPHYCLNIGFTWAGLQCLGVAPEVLSAFPAAFQQGAAQRALAPDPDFADGIGLGDDGDSAPANWILGGAGTPAVHILLSLYTDEHRITRLEHISTRLRERFAACGLTEFFHMDAEAFPHGRMHFGYRDGIAQPQLVGGPARERPDMQPKAPTGDFLLGRDYVNVFGGNYLGSLPPALCDNATYGAFRILRQDVRAFEGLLERWGRHTQLHPEYIAAKILGRWRNGMPLTLAPQRDETDPPVKQWHINDFDYAPAPGHDTFFDDVEGKRCPIGSHVRRMNPRSALAMGLPHSRRLLRRNMPYGPPFKADAQDDDVERGLIGFFVCGDIEEQFEFMLRVWANQDIATHGLRGTRDPIIGAQRDDDGIFVLRTDDSRDPIVMTELPRLVHTRGSVYCLIPGLGGLRHLAGLADPPPAGIAAPTQAGSAA